MKSRPIGVMFFSSLLIIAAIYFSNFLIKELAQESFAKVAVSIVTIFFMFHTAVYLWQLKELGRTGIIAIAFIFLGLGVLYLVPSFLLSKEIQSLILGPLFALSSLTALIYFTRPQIKQRFK